MYVGLTLRYFPNYQDGATATYIAAQNNVSLALMRTIIHLGRGDVNRPRLDGITPVLIAAERNVTIELMKLLLESGGDLQRLRQVN